MSDRTILALIAALALVVCFAGCSGNGADEEEPMAGPAGMDGPMPGGPEGPMPDGPPGDGPPAPGPAPDAGPPAGPGPEPEAEPAVEEEELEEGATPVVLETFKARVVEVVDGDTIKVARDGDLHPVRIYGISTPTGRMSFARLARQKTAWLVLNRTVTVHELETGPYDDCGQMVAEVITPAGESVAEILLESGLAWWYDRYAPGKKAFGALQEDARAEMRGMWIDPYAAPPWDFRDAAHVTAAWGDVVPGAPDGDEAGPGDGAAGPDGPGPELG